MRRLYLLILPLLAGCATGPSLQSRMAAYTGASAQTLVQDLGVPDKQISAGGVQYLAYNQHHTEITPGVGGFGGYGGLGPFYGGPFYGDSLFAGGLYGGIPPQVVDYSCETTFMLRHDRVFGFTLRGNDCG